MNAKAGKGLDTRADYYLLRKLFPAPPVRRLSLCRAVERACGPGGAACQGLAAPPSCQPWERKAADLSPALAAATFPDLLVRLSPSTPPRAPAMASHRWVRPQPEDPPCSGCSVLPRPPATSTTSYALVMDVNSDWTSTAGDAASPSIQAAFLVIDCPERSGKRSYSIPLPTPLQDRVLDLGALQEESLRGCSAALELSVTDANGATISVQNPVYVDP